LTAYATDADSIRRAAKRIAEHTHRTPIFTSRTLDALSGRHLVFKAESLQKGGAFKFRGACNAVLLLDDAQTAHGVVTHSSGNHAQALALAARLRGTTAHIVMPRGSAAVKRRAVEGYGGIVHECEPTLDARERRAHEVRAATGATLIPPFDHPDVIAGQGTVALELCEQAPELDAIVAPVGGGGLVSGIALWASSLARPVRVIGAEPTGADDAARSKAFGQLMPLLESKTLADGLRTGLGQLTWPVIRDRVERIITVDDDATIAALRLVWERMKLVIEPSAAVAVAAVLSDELSALDGLERVGVVLSGGNVDLDELPFGQQPQ
jgi:threonine dehydratase/serine racemase